MKTLDKFIDAKIPNAPKHIAGYLYSKETLRLLMHETAQATIKALMPNVENHFPINLEFQSGVQSTKHYFYRRAKEWMGEKKVRR